MSKNNIFITGADGFIGSHICEALVIKGYNVKALCQYNSFNSFGWLDHIDPKLKGEFEIVLGDIRDKSQMLLYIKNQETVIHLAALIGIPYSYIAPQSYIDTNVSGTLNILEASRDRNVSRIIHTSTSEVYGSAQYVPIDEKHPTNCQSPYSASKLAGDQLALSFNSSFDLPVSIIRPFNTYGPRQSLRAVIPTIITQCLNNDYKIKLGSLNPTRDFNYIDDTVNGFLSCLENKDIDGQIINIGSNFEISIKQTTQMILDNLNKKHLVALDKNRIRPLNSEVNRLFCNNDLAFKLLNWKPKYANINGFKKGLEKTINWFSNEKNLKKYKNTGYII